MAPLSRFPNKPEFQVHAFGGVFRGDMALTLAGLSTPKVAGDHLKIRGNTIIITGVEEIYLNPYILKRYYDRRILDRVSDLFERGKDSDVRGLLYQQRERPYGVARWNVPYSYDLNLETWKALIELRTATYLLRQGARVPEQEAVSETIWLEGLANARSGVPVYPKKMLARAHECLNRSALYEDAAETAVWTRITDVGKLALQKNGNIEPLDQGLAKLEVSLQPPTRLDIGRQGLIYHRLGFSGLQHALSYFLAGLMAM